MQHIASNLDSHEADLAQKHLNRRELSTKAPDSCSDLSPKTQSQRQMTHIGQKAQNIIECLASTCLHLNWNHSSLKIKYDVRESLCPS